MAEGDIYKFLARALWWPTSETDVGYNAVWWMSADRKGMAAIAARSIPEFMSRVGWVNTREKTTNVYFETSTQQFWRVSKTTNKRQPAKSKEGAVFSKCLFLDLDVASPNDDPKLAKTKFSSKNEAVAELDRFLKEEPRLAPIHAVVDSGGGLQVYWFFEKPQVRADWEQYASGLKALCVQHRFKADPSVTGDIARVMRMPGTMNKKYDPPRPAFLRYVRDERCAAEEQLAFLKQIAPITVAPVTGSELCEFDASVGPVAAFKGQKIEKLSDGITRTEMPPLNPKPLASKCAFFEEACRTRGAAFGQPLWNLSTLMCVFLENGHDIAHAISSGHKDYTHDETEKLWERKNQEHEKGLGWPSCKSIEGNGFAGCAACPNRGKVRSPLNLLSPSVPVVTGFSSVTAAVTTGTDVLYEIPQSAYPLEPLNLPSGYAEIDHVIHYTDGDTPKRLFKCKLFNPAVQLDPLALNFGATLERGEAVSAQVLHADLEENTLYKSLLAQDVKVNPSAKKLLADFMSSWLSRLQELKRSTQANAYGWIGDNKNPTGFVFNATVFRPDGTNVPAPRADLKERKIFKAEGELKPWMDCMEMICHLQRPENEMILASAFGGPLMRFTGNAGCALSAWSKDSGAFKSTASMCAQAVWGHPKAGRGMQTSTERAMINKAAVLRHLPLYMDEIHELPYMEVVKKAISSVTQGTTGDIMKRDGRHSVEKRAYDCTLYCCGNKSLVDYMKDVQIETEASVVRVFEYEMYPVATDYQFATTAVKANELTNALLNNYGVMGVLYSKELAVLGSTLEARINLFQEEFNARVQAKFKERFWSSIVAAHVVGAEIANTLGCKFHIPEMIAFAEQCFYNQRTKHEANVNTAGSQHTVEEVLGSFLSAVNDETIWTKEFDATPTEIVHIPQRKEFVVAQFAVKEGLLRILRPRLNEYMKSRGLSSGVTNGIIEKLGATVRGNTTLAVGTAWQGQRSTVIEIPVPMSSFLYPYMTRYGEEALPSSSVGIAGSPQLPIQSHQPTGIAPATP